MHISAGAKETRCPVPGVTGGCEPPVRGAGMELRSWRSILLTTMPYLQP